MGLYHEIFYCRSNSCFLSCFIEIVFYRTKILEVESCSSGNQTRQVKLFSLKSRDGELSSVSVMGLGWQLLYLSRHFNIFFLSRSKFVKTFFVWFAGVTHGSVFYIGILSYLLLVWSRTSRNKVLKSFVFHGTKFLWNQVLTGTVKRDWDGLKVV
jgi:hypothetical protein